jgi:hypothetical protein
LRAGLVERARCVDADDGVGAILRGKADNHAALG